MRAGSPCVLTPSASPQTRAHPAESCTDSRGLEYRSLRSCWPPATESHWNGWPRFLQMTRRQELAAPRTAATTTPHPCVPWAFYCLYSGKGRKAVCLFYLFNKRKHNHSLTHYSWWMHRKNNLYIRGGERSGGGGRRKTYWLPAESSIRRQRKTHSNGARRQMGCLQPSLRCEDRTNR